ncbi:MAG: hypothetical protein COB35_11310 [Gammaproteobacteria bacterium]|nr:MAG: hypothetical protein COB35_11310 [Gammaproteobacteria bacterium]
MQNTYIARQAILDHKSRTVGYELLFRNSPDNHFPEIDPDMATSKLIIQNHIHGDITALSLGKPAYINFTEQCLIHKYPLMFDKKCIVIELVGQSKPTSRLIKIVKYYHDQGYKIALTEYDVEDHWDILLPFLSVVKVDIEKINPKRLHPIKAKTKALNVKLAAEKVETRYQLQSLAEVGFNYFQGYFYHEPEIIEGQTLNPIKTHMLHLMSETFKTPLDYNAVASIISQDVNLTIGILKMVNNVATGVRIEITSLKQASTYLGEEKLKQFVSILALSKLTSESTDEVSKQALITAKLMMSLAFESNVFKEVKDFAFITGLLSSIEIILSMPISDIMKSMPLAEPIEKALVEHSGLLGDLLVLTTNYILGKGENVTALNDQFSLNAEFIQQEFIAASQWCTDLDIH